MNNQSMFRFPFQEAFEHFLINPQTNWERFFNPQFFINYNAPDVAVENRVLSQVGSYGKQLGRVLDVLAVLVARLPSDDLTPQERRVLDEFLDLSRRVKTAIADYRGRRDEGITVGDVDHLIDGLRSLARTDPTAHRALVERLQGAIAQGEASA